MSDKEGEWGGFRQDVIVSIFMVVVLMYFSIVTILLSNV